jgi:hypothetical protein
LPQEVLQDALSSIHTCFSPMGSTFFLQLFVLFEPMVIFIIKGQDK